MLNPISNLTLLLMVPLPGWEQDQLVIPWYLLTSKLLLFPSCHHNGRWPCPNICKADRWMCVGWRGNIHMHGCLLSFYVYATAELINVSHILYHWEQFFKKLHNRCLSCSIEPCIKGERKLRFWRSVPLSDHFMWWTSSFDKVSIACVHAWLCLFVLVSQVRSLRSITVTRQWQNKSIINYKRTTKLIWLF